MPIRLEIVTQEKLVYSEDVDIVVLPGSEGEMGILPHHTLVLTTLKLGELRVRRGGVEESFAIYGGVAEVRPDKVIVLADMAEHAEAIDLALAEVARARAAELMASGPPPDKLALIAQELRRAELAVRVRRKTQSRAGAVRIRASDSENPSSHR